MPMKPMTLSQLKLISAAERLAALAEGLEQKLVAAHVESIGSLIKPETSPVIAGNNLGVRYSQTMADIDARYVGTELTIAAAEVRVAIDEVLGRLST